MIGTGKIIFKQKLKDFSKFHLLFLFALSIWCLSVPFDNAIYQVSWMLLSVLFLTHVFYYKNFKDVMKILNSLKIYLVLFVLLCIVLVVSNLLNYEYLAPKTWHFLAGFVFRYAFVLLALFYFYKQYPFDEKFIIYLSIIAICFMASSGIYEFINNYEKIVFFQDSGHGLSGFLRNRNGFGLSMATGFAMIFIFLKNNAFKNTLMIIFTFLIIFSFSRSAWVASVVIVLFYAAFNYKNIQIKHIYYCILICGLIIAVFMLSDSFQYRFSQLTQGYSSHRFGIWQYSFEMFLKQPFFGWGDTFKFIPNAPYLINHHYSAPHNMIMELLYNTGVFGFCIFMLLNFYIFKHLIKTKNIKILSMFVFFFTICQFDYGVFSTKEVLNYIVIFSFLGLKNRALV